MIKKIPFADLKIGMYVHDLDTDWFNHPFMRNQFPVREASEVERIRAAGITSLYIDTDKGLDVADAPTREEVRQRVHEEMVQAVSAEAPIIRMTVAEEMGRAGRIKNQAKVAVQQVMNDVRLGKVVQVSSLEPLVEEISNSISRSSGALTALLQIKTADEYTFLHSVAVCALMVSFTRSVGFDSSVVQLAGMGGLLHDTGKMKIPSEVLNKPGRLTEAEFELIKQHPRLGWDVLKDVPEIPDIALDITLHHHERFGGGGYPHGLQGEQISTLARMAAVVDVYDAITSNRCYHVGLAPTEALRRMWEWTPSHLDPKLVQAFIRMVGIYPVGSMVKLESGRIGVVSESNTEEMLKPRVKVFFSRRSNSYIPVQEIDLARAPGSADRIVDYEDASGYKVDPMRILAGV
ncbi:HD-GYP domain-containing protein [Amantichitinum ursilacus]|uniref:Cyclic di-GMP phosphodiesterase response regulator RpfG n=1 Tax=Amantichitinum ursilacus TaxID=857265 RepID=A0A0N0GP01_9NEIS|nr:HD-GYP domain-containing protein [Amantichitinum ursilacus]KPC53053.1 Cyclic di-GMP phosphodiesterase response regulator RpfG [Amantichitinum ursilacus]